MGADLTVGLQGKNELSVTAELTAARFGSGLVEVYATPAMIALMEKTCLESVTPFLDAGMGTVGTKVEVSHERATPVGMQVVCESTLTEVDRRRLVFEVLASDEVGIIGRSRHERFIIDIKSFTEKTYQQKK